VSHPLLTNSYHILVPVSCLRVDFTGLLVDRVYSRVFLVLFEKLYLLIAKHGCCYTDYNFEVISLLQLLNALNFLFNNSEASFPIASF